MTSKKNNQKETVKIEQFLLQIGTPESKKMNGLRHVFNGETPEDEAALFKSALTYHKEKVEPYLAEYKEEQLFPYPEDQELHDSIHKLPLQDRAVWVLTYFHALSSTSISMIINESEDSVVIRQQAAREKLHTLLTNGENGLSESQLDKSIDFLLGAYEKLELPGVIEDEELPEPEEFTDNVAEEPKPVSRFKWAGPASVTLMILLIGLAFMLPAFEPGSGSQNESAEEEQEEEQDEEPELPRIPEEEIKDLEEAISENFSSLESKTGLTKRELRQINYIYQTSTVAEEARTINSLDDYEEHERDFVVNFSNHKEYLTYELKTPMEFVDEEIENIGSQDYGPDPFAFSDMLAGTLIYRSKGFEHVR
ncbi:hypothetical protein P6709_08655 [Jeotgalibacillus sp. ET6]|uniref:hypothetical protein n=1 Tax=Jeotgalibacillus sp. ET6 TaxID=3037260 RepID=UPI00241848BC|nr:hypothetical protein [Jeotgalibacillus sp. ET6]MDG5471817.1 hypothetical protein [Jeotgalibacillus sp. ET6]